MSLVVHVNQTMAYCRLANIDEAAEVTWGNQVFRPFRPSANLYEYLRSHRERRIVGVELHLSSLDYGKLLTGLPGFQELAALPIMRSRWRFWFVHEPADIEWDQILTENPYISEKGDVLLVLQLWHLRDEEFDNLARFAQSESIHVIG